MEQLARKGASTKQADVQRCRADAYDLERPIDVESHERRYVVIARRGSLGAEGEALG